MSKLIIILIPLQIGYKTIFFIPYTISYFTIRFVTTLILRIDVENVLSEHCNANYFSTISIRDIHKGS